MPAEPFLVLDRLEKRFGEQPVIRRLSLAVVEGEVLALLGPSGSGKTTLLRLLAGFEVPDRGAIVVGGADVAHLPPARRQFGMVFQHYALFPHLTVGENVAFGLATAARDEVTPRVAEMLRLVDLAGFESRKVGEISGGQQQRVALARALAPKPRLLLLDEPLSNLDPALRERTRRELKAAFQRVGITTVLVTHEQEEAFDLGDRVAVLHEGRLDQIGTPEELYAEPRTRFVATFVGRASRLRGSYVASRDGGPVFEAAPGLPRWRCVASGDHEPSTGTPVELVVRPESLALTEPGSEGSRPGTVTESRFTGLATYATVRLAEPSGEDSGDELEVLVRGDRAASVDDRVGVAPSGAGPTPRAFRLGDPPAEDSP